MVKHGYQMVRYADDFVILTESEAQAQQALELIRQWMQAAQLRLHPEKTRIVDTRQAGGFDSWVTTSNGARNGRARRAYAT
jgi:RNA-directed DNA polymerase